MSLAKSIAVAAALAFTIPAHAGSNAQGPHGGIAAARGMGHGPSAASFGGVSAAPGQSGQGGRYQESVVDSFQPWPESEMRRFQKPRWEPYAGD